MPTRTRTATLPTWWWELQHRTGTWVRHLAGDDEGPRYEALAAAIAEGGPGRSVLDLGCAHGLLASHLAAGPDPGPYLGVDISQAAVDAARLAVPDPTGRIRFEVADLRSWTPPAPADVIVFNEMLYYFTQPASLVERYLPWLAPGGSVWVSMYQPTWPRNPLMRLRIDAIWARLGRQLEVRRRLEVRDERQVVRFRIAELAARPEAP